MPDRPPVRVAIVDDEPLAREQLRALLADESDVSLVGEAGGGSAAIRMIATEKPDIVLLDVQMPGADGFEVLRAVSPLHQPVVVFVTAHDDHAVRAFDVAAIDYLLKPVVESRFRAAIRRAVERVTTARPGELSHGMTHLLEQLPTSMTADRIPVRHDGRVTFVRARDIDRVSADDDHVRLHVGTAVHPLRQTMAQMETRLAAAGTGARFVRVHRSAIVNIDRIREVQPWVKGDFVLILTDGTQIVTGRTYRERVLALLR
jgi:two-component system LytT family response regulator